MICRSNSSSNAFTIIARGICTSLIVRGGAKSSLRKRDRMVTLEQPSILLHSLWLALSGQLSMTCRWTADFFFNDVLIT